MDFNIGDKVLIQNESEDFGEIGIVKKINDNGNMLVKIFDKTWSIVFVNKMDALLLVEGY